MNLHPGTHVQARNAYGNMISMVVVSDPERGKDFPIVWVCSEAAYDRAQIDGSDLDAVPWPLDAVQEALPA